MQCVKAMDQHTSLTVDRKLKRLSNSSPWDWAGLLAAPVGLGVDWYCCKIRGFMKRRIFERIRASNSNGGRSPKKSKVIILATFSIILSLVWIQSFHIETVRLLQIIQCSTNWWNTENRPMKVRKVRETFDFFQQVCKAFHYETVGVQKTFRHRER